MKGYPPSTPGCHPDDCRTQDLPGHGPRDDEYETCRTCDCFDKGRCLRDKVQAWANDEACGEWIWRRED